MSEEDAAMRKSSSPQQLLPGEGTGQQQHTVRLVYPGNKLPLPLLPSSVLSWCPQGVLSTSTATRQLEDRQPSRLDTQERIVGRGWQASTHCSLASAKCDGFMKRYAYRISDIRNHVLQLWTVNRCLFSLLSWWPVPVISLSSSSSNLASLPQHRNNPGCLFFLPKANSNCGVASHLNNWSKTLSLGYSWWSASFDQML